MAQGMVAVLALVNLIALAQMNKATQAGLVASGIVTLAFLVIVFFILFPDDDTPETPDDDTPEEPDASN